tara:strand:+ start:847 stop:1026 length:180 start_codon:yes stop_codon:yes gene_type:complete
MLSAHTYFKRGDIMNDNELHGDEYLLDDADEYPPVEQWEIDEALADIKADLQWLEEYSE